MIPGCTEVGVSSLAAQCQTRKPVKSVTPDSDQSEKPEQSTENRQEQIEE
jgi:hypothetical protein